jgi:hypothetical protein
MSDLHRAPDKDAGAHDKRHQTHHQPEDRPADRHGADVEFLLHLAPQRIGFFPQTLPDEYGYDLLCKVISPTLVCPAVGFQKDQAG